ncbi:amidohydrolase family protein [Gemmatimonas sp.]|uniref:amidohydrolase family protein n=1 Tax=Gemmatimonas sp. TaxID=1962908 RepID=UPI0039834679
MRVTLSLLASFLLLNGCPTAVVRSGPVAAEGTAFAIRGVTVVDVERGILLPHRTVLVRGTRIVAVDSGAPQLLAGVTVVNGAEKYLIPGLWDMHGHVLNRWSWRAPLVVANGVTGVRDMATWTPLAEVRQLRANVQAGREIGPRFVSEGPLLDGEPALFKEYLAVGTVDRARQVVDSLHAAGAQFIKIYTHLPRVLLDAIIERAQYHGLPFVGHVPLALTTGEASDLGMRGVEHAYRHRMARATAETEIRRLLVGELETQQRGDPVARERLADSAFLMGIETYDRNMCVALGARFARNGTWFVPTLVEMRSRFLPEPRTREAFDSLFTQPKLLDMPRSLVANWRDQEMYQRGLQDHAASTREQYETAARNRAREIETRLRMTADLHRGGAGILAGTDAAITFPLVMLGSSVHEELVLLVEAGLTPL